MDLKHIIKRTVACILLFTCLILPLSGCGQGGQEALERLRERAPELLDLIATKNYEAIYSVFYPDTISKDDVIPFVESIEAYCPLSNGYTITEQSFDSYNKIGGDKQNIAMIVYELKTGTDEVFYLETAYLITKDTEGVAGFHVYNQADYALYQSDKSGK